MTEEGWKNSNLSLVDTCYEPLPYSLFALSLAFIFAALIIHIVLTIFTVIHALRLKRRMETPQRTWVMNLDMIAEDSEEYINRMYKVFHDKKHILKASRRKSNSGRSKSLIPIMLPKGETGAKSHRSMSNMEMRSSVSRIARSNSEEEASFMLKVLNYPEIYYKNLPAPPERRDSLIQQLRKKMGSISSASPAEKIKQEVTMRGKTIISETSEKDSKL